jgi:hypothetical protein
MIESSETLYRRRTPAALVAICISVVTIAIGCLSCNSPSSSIPQGGDSNQYVEAYKAATWGSTMTVSFPSSCEMTITTTGKPNYSPNPYYLAPASGGQTVVAHTAVTNTPLAVISYSGMIEPRLLGSSATINSCPTLATNPTPTSGGAIGYLISGTAMFDSFEMDASTPALSDNASYAFTDGSGTVQTAYFLDPCASHSNGSTWHAHGNPDCVTSQIDSTNGASHIIGVALDGFPIYGGRDINGNVTSVSQLDACNGINSATPEFPNGAYHYVLPIGVTSKYASLNCYSGAPSPEAMAAAEQLACVMKAMFAVTGSKRQKQAAPAEMAMPDRTIMHRSPARSVVL